MRSTTLHAEFQQLRKERDRAQAEVMRLHQELATTKRDWRRELIKVRNSHTPALDVYLTLLMRLHAAVDEAHAQRSEAFVCDDPHLITPRIETELEHLDVGQMRFVPLLFGKHRRTIWRSDANTYFLTEGNGKVHTVRRTGNDSKPFQGLAADVQMLLEGFGAVDLSESVQNVPCDLFSSLATIFCSLDVPVGIDAEKSQLMVKPAALQMWMQIARHRSELTTARIVAHGTSRETVRMIAEDPFGFSLLHAAKHGELKGRGVYVSLYNSIAAGYNRGNPDGTILLCLLLTGDALENNNSVTPYPFLGPSTDAVCVHETCLILVLGIVVPHVEDAPVEVS